MSKIALTFSASLALVVTFLTSVVGKFPDWVANNILSKGSSLHYLLFSEMKYDLLALAVAATLSPQILAAAKWSLDTSIRLAFHSAYCLISPNRRLTGIFLIASLFIAALSLGLFIQAVESYVFVAAREYHYSKQINRNRMVYQANDLGKAHLTDSIELLREIRKLNPDNPENDINSYIERYEKIRSNSDQLTQAGDSLAKRKSYALAVVYYQLAVRVFRDNEVAKNRISKYKDEFDGSKADLERFFALCKDRGNLRTLVERIDDFGFAVREPASVKRLKAKGMDDDGAGRIYLQLCADALHFDTPENYITTLRTRIFASDGRGGA
ncbi:hypothetical protein [Rhodopseudomonas sp. B29]|uniref:hypothetical protein n=1 Tax=Rhodopseudomonas sp. B29 TaxID=95607 RepID=UPI0003B3B7C1|nr:hypothetical protein [Rhodopseudomonas sp. B29]